ncbi:MAG: hypothetical protein ACI9HK_000062, partial [Pirellulaceae bacterium]
ALVDQFLLKYGVSNINWLGGYSGQLDNNGERIQLLRPDTPPLGEPGFVPLLLEDEVKYRESAPWAEAASGRGFSLSRIGISTWGNDPFSWAADTPTPGGADSTPTVRSVTMNAGLEDPADLSKGPQPSNWLSQRSDIRTLLVEFSEPLDVTAADVVLTNLGIDADVDPDAVIPITDNQLSLTDNQLTIFFDANALPSGVYQLEFLATASDSANQPLANFVLTGDVNNNFYKLTAEWNGDTGVSVFDFTTFSYWFGVSIPTAPAYADLNDDDGISVFDFTGFSSNFGVGVKFPVGLTNGNVSEPAAGALELAATALQRESANGDFASGEVEHGNDLALAAILVEWGKLDSPLSDPALEFVCERDCGAERAEPEIN